MVRHFQQSEHALKFIAQWSVVAGVHILIKFLGGGGELDCGTDFPNSDIQI